jgi:hypothetical protein
MGRGLCHYAANVQPECKCVPNCTDTHFRCVQEDYLPRPRGSSASCKRRHRDDWNAGSRVRRKSFAGGLSSQAARARFNSVGTLRASPFAAPSSNLSKSSRSPLCHCGVESQVPPDSLLAESAAIQALEAFAEHCSTFRMTPGYCRPAKEYLQSKRHAGRIAGRREQSLEDHALATAHQQSVHNKTGGSSPWNCSAAGGKLFLNQRNGCASWQAATRHIPFRLFFAGR